jgi:hypothetical protein
MEFANLKNESVGNLYDDCGVEDRLLECESNAHEHENLRIDKNLEVSKK